MYLAHKNYKVANVPLVPEIPPPQELFVISPKKIIGLTADPDKLNQIRRERLKTLGLNDSANYASMERILQELEYADALFKRLGCTVIDVSKSRGRNGQHSYASFKGGVKDGQIRLYVPGRAGRNEGPAGRQGGQPG